MDPGARVGALQSTDSWCWWNAADAGNVALLPTASQCARGAAGGQRGAVAAVSSGNCLPTRGTPCRWGASVQRPPSWGPSWRTSTLSVGDQCLLVQEGAASTLRGPLQVPPLPEATAVPGGQTFPRLLLTTSVSSCWAGLVGPRHRRGLVARQQCTHLEVEQGTKGHVLGTRTRILQQG